MLHRRAGTLDAHAEAALVWHARDGGPYDRARTELAWGERLRRRRRRIPRARAAGGGARTVPRARRRAVGAAPQPTS